MTNPSHPPSPFTSMIRALLYPKHDTRTQWTVRCQGPQATQRQQRKIRLNGSLKVSISISAQTVLVLLSVLQYFGSIPFTPIDLAMKCVLPYVLVSPYQFLSVPHCISLAISIPFRSTLHFYLYPIRICS
ncbi:hypothetical protein H4Q26_015433 [Puccinia striiformis f. sp. tritici PST-130]|nr:hypothetical protein H4Q26_015433 [Puccinia striiformis f. sp. tritici PST-130]